MQVILFANSQNLEYIAWKGEFDFVGALVIHGGRGDVVIFVVGISTSHVEFTLGIAFSSTSVAGLTHATVRCHGWKFYDQNRSG